MEYCYYNCKCHSWLAFYSMHNELILGKKCNLKGDPSRIFPQKNELRRTIFFRVFFKLIVEKGAKLSFKRFLIYLFKFQKLYVLKNQANISSAVCWQTTYIYTYQFEICPLWQCFINKVRQLRCSRWCYWWWWCPQFWWSENRGGQDKK